jgi:hypothetical protein
MVNFVERIKTFIQEIIYSLLIGPILNLIFLDVEHSEIPQEHKCAHILALDNGNFAAQPNNRILWHVNNYTTDNDWPDYKVQNTIWDVERRGLDYRRF